MTRFVIRRILQSLLLIWAVMTLSFILTRLAPGGPEAIYFENRNIGPEEIAAIRRSRGLDAPIFVQYFQWLWQTITLDFGVAYSYARRPVVEVIWTKLIPTFQLGLMSYLIALLGIPLGLYAARHRGKLGDNLVRIFTVVGSAVPSFWLGLVVIIILVNTVRWFPQGQGSDGIGSWFLHIIIPALILSSGGLVAFTRFVRSETIETLGQDYVRTARAKGIADKKVQRSHVLRNSLIPVVTLMGAFLPTIVGGAAIIETIFNWPGMGQLFITAASARDYSILLSILLIGTFLTILGTFLADIAYGFVDPRIRYDRT
jgi:peptide/nickel transport system permease protein